ncbi:hypothetical protein NIA28_11345 [Coprococcus catus]|uniref:hypothetical protein n=1 Tax=Coprococcus catus TaxID=116085 RepID=UPI0020972B51|nr:hypothetical protein [Coprococcus catus]MCO7146942.1 hypothetical protein [Coprococcus catus]
MWNDWNFWCSIITAIAAIVALILSVKQSRLSNKQQLFERRLKAYMLANGLISLCKDNYGWISAKREERPQLENDWNFMWLTNNSYMEEQAKAIEHPLEQPFHKEFLRKREELRKQAMEFELIFKGDVALKYSGFLRAYENALDKMYQYQIIIDKMKKANEENPVTVEEAGKTFSEEKYRADLYNALDNLRKTYDVVAQDKVEKQLKKQLSLI